MQLLTMRPASTPVPGFRLPSSQPRSPLPGARPQPIVPSLDSALPRDIGSRFGRRIRELRHARGLTQNEVAVTFGIDRTFISDVERGRKGVGLPTLEIFALGFGVSLSDMLRGL